jgi:hypothetical protein
MAKFFLVIKLKLRIWIWQPAMATKRREANTFLTINKNTARIILLAAWWMGSKNIFDNSQSVWPPLENSSALLSFYNYTFDSTRGAAKKNKRGADFGRTQKFAWAARALCPAAVAAGRRRIVVLFRWFPPRSYK